MKALAQWRSAPHAGVFFSAPQLAAIGDLRAEVGDAQHRRDDAGAEHGAGARSASPATP